MVLGGGCAIWLKTVGPHRRYPAYPRELHKRGDVAGIGSAKCESFGFVSVSSPFAHHRELREGGSVAGVDSAPEERLGSASISTPFAHPRELRERGGVAGIGSTPVKRFGSPSVSSPLSHPRKLHKCGGVAGIGGTPEQRLGPGQAVTDSGSVAQVYKIARVVEEHVGGVPERQRGTKHAAFAAPELLKVVSELIARSGRRLQTGYRAVCR